MKDNWVLFSGCSNCSNNGIYRQGYIKKLIVTGGAGEGNDQSDAYAAKQYAVLQGIPEQDILTEDVSTITQENLEFSRIIMEQNNYHTAIIVSDPLHMRRAMLLAEDIGINGGGCFIYLHKIPMDYSRIADRLKCHRIHFLYLIMILWYDV